VPRYVPLLWRLFVPNAVVLSVACLVLIVEPANGRIPALVGGLAVLLLVDLALMRRIFRPLERLTELTRRVDPLRPGARIPPGGPASEVSVLAAAFNDMLDRLEDERRESARRMLDEREHERRRVADELHDQIGQQLTEVALQTARVAAVAPPEAAGPLQDIHASMLDGIEDVRRLARELRPEGLDALGLVPALVNMLERLSESTGVRIVRDLQRDLPPLTENAQIVLYRVAQESCTNAIRHGQPQTVWVTLGVREGQVQLTVADDGRGISDAGAGVGGIRTMRERAVLLGAELTIGPRPDGPGTRVFLGFDPVRA
jgi:two-component system sensor histidine kinase UhpB